MDLERLRKFVILEYEIKDAGFKRLIDYVLERIPDVHEEDFPSFSIYEGHAIEGAHVTEDSVIFDVDKLKNELSDGDEDVMVGIIAHELAHVFLKHGSVPDMVERGLEYEDEADRLASNWGFAKEVTAFRHKLGPPTLEG